MDEDYAEYRCSACKKPIKSKAIRCKTCVDKLFYHPSCLNRHRIYNRNKELVACDGSFDEILVENSDKDRIGASGSAGPSRAVTRKVTMGSTGYVGVVESRCGDKTTNGSSSMDGKIDWLIRTVKEIKDEIACKGEVKKMINEVIKEEMDYIKQELEDLRKLVQEGRNRPTDSTHSKYSDAVKKKKENIIIIKPKTQQESETTKKVIKEKVDIMNMPMGVTKLRKGKEGSVILGCENGDDKVKLKDAVQSKLGEMYNVTESVRTKPKLKIINIDKEIMELEDEELIQTIKKQNSIEESHIDIVKRILKRNKDTSQPGNKRREDGSIIIEANEQTHDLLLKREKLNIGWRKCPVYNHISIKRCFKCWGFYHIAKNCTREVTCHKCAGKHTASVCNEKTNKCVNCMFKIITYNLKINDEHDALSPECPTYKRAIEEEKRRAGWEAKKK